MDAHRFVTVFDAGTAGFKNWDFPAAGLIFVAVGLAIFLGPRLIRALGIPLADSLSPRGRFFRFGFLGFAIFWTVMAFAMTFGSYWHHHALVRDNLCRMVEGTVDNFVPMPATGHADESFAVSGVYFSYSDYGVTDGFNNAASLGGPIRSGQYVRICYDPADHAILRLQIRDYRGPLPDYAAPSMSFTVPARNDEPPMPVPWYANIWPIVLLLDFAGIVAMYRPYLRTFWRLRTVAVSAPVSAAVLHNDSRVKLRNVLVAPDRRMDALWLRPRGFNLYYVPMLVAKLNVDPAAAKVSSYEIRFSSGIPVMLALFLFGACMFLSQVPDFAGVPVAIFVPVFAVVAIGLNGLALRGKRDRMIELVDEALVELAA